MKPTVAVVGGFLGAGKTTLILKAARILRERGVRAAAILNDQGGDLVDTELARRHGVDADEVRGGCFCCRFPELLDALERLRAHSPEVIFCEAVGSCTDVAATVVRPLLRDYSADWCVAPLTVLVHDRPEEPDLRYLYDLQVGEADCVIGRDVDVGEWLDRLLDRGMEAGARRIVVDYARYAEAEAALGWLNARATVCPDPAVAPAMVVGPLLDDLDRALTARGIRIVHLKAMAQCESGYVKAAVTKNGEEPVVEGALDASPAGEHEVYLNLRALGDPEELREVVEAAFAFAGRLSVEAFRPAAPRAGDGREAD